MDGYLVKTEKEGESATMDATATLQQMLANSGVLMSQLQLLSNAGDGSSGTAAASLPWMAVSPYQVMVLPQSLLAAQNIAATTQDGQIVLAPSTAVADGQVLKTDQASASMLDQAVAALLQKQQEAAQKNQSNAAAAAAVNMAALQHLKKDDGRDGEPNAKIAKLDGDLGIKPPKKPLTPYMTFSKMVWPHVKATHPHLSSVVEIGAVVGSMWRDLDPVEKQNYIEQFTREKLVYDEEMHVYLKTTGLQASDLIKPKVKKKDLHHRPNPATVMNPAHRQATPMKTTATVAANGGTTSGGLTVAGQQLVQTLMGLQTPAAGSNAASTAASQSLQQLLQQLGLSGQTVYANSDGTISVDGSILTIQGQPVHLAGQTAAYSDQNQFLTTNVTATTDTAAAAVDGTRSLSWHQPTTVSSAPQQDGQSGVVLYQLPATNGSAASAGSADGLLSAAATDGGNQQANATAPVYYSVDQFGQLVRHEARPASATAAASSAEENRLQLEIINLQTALEQKTREADDLRAQLAEVYGAIERYKTDTAAANGSAGAGCSTEDDNAAAATAAAAANAAAVKEEKTVNDEANGGLGPATTSS